MKLWDWGAYPENDTDMPDHKIAAWGIEQLNQRFDQPLFLATGFYRPHVPQSFRSGLIYTHWIVCNYPFP